MQTVFGFTLAICIWDWYASDSNFVELCVVAGRSRTRASSLSTAVLYCGLEKSGMVGDGMGAAWKV